MNQLYTSRRWCPSLSPAFSAFVPGWTEEMKIPLSLPPTSVMSFSRLSPRNDTSCTGFNDELSLEKEDREGRNGLQAHKQAVRERRKHISFIDVQLTRTSPERAS